MDIYVTDSYNVFLSTRTSQLVAPLNNFLPDIVSKSGLWKLVDEELSLYASWKLTQKINKTLKEELLSSAKQMPNGSGYPPVPEGYENVYKSNTKEAKDGLHDSEASIIGLLATCGAVLDHLWSATKGLHDNSGGKLWSDAMGKKKIDGKWRSKKDLLIMLFDAQNPHKDKQDNDGNVVNMYAELSRLVEWRNTRVHRNPLQCWAHGSKQELKLVFSDTNPFVKEEPSITIDEDDLRKALTWLGLFLTWWVGRTMAYVEASA